jgi:hypothetical protein
VTHSSTYCNSTASASSDPCLPSHNLGRFHNVAGDRLTKTPADVLQQRNRTQERWKELKVAMKDEIERTEGSNEGWDTGAWRWKSDKERASFIHNLHIDYYCCLSPYRCTDAHLIATGITAYHTLYKPYCLIGTISTVYYAIAPSWFLLVLFLLPHSPDMRQTTSPFYTLSLTSIAYDVIHRHSDSPSHQYQSIGTFLYSSKSNRLMPVASGILFYPS